MYIFVYGDAAQPIRHVLKMGDTTVGRAENCDLRISEPSMSRWHACFTVTNNSCVLADVGSRNGTFVNNLQITKVEVHDGDHIHLGDVAARLEVSAEDQLKIVERPTVAFPYTLDRKVDETPAAQPTIDARRLLTLISDMSRSLAKNQPLANILEEVVRLAAESTNAERAFLILKDEKTGALVPRVARTREKRTRPQQGAVSRTVLNRVMQERVAMLASNAHTDLKRRRYGRPGRCRTSARSCARRCGARTTRSGRCISTRRSRPSSSPPIWSCWWRFPTTPPSPSSRHDSPTGCTKRRVEVSGWDDTTRRLLSTRILQESGDADAPLLAQERAISVLFADIVGFTSMAEHMPPQQVATLLNACFTRMTDIVFEHEGTLDKYIGDCLLAVFGAPLDQPDHAVRAVQDGAGHRARAGKTQSRDEWSTAQAADGDQLGRRARRRHRLAATTGIHSARRRRQHRISPAVGGRQSRTDRHRQGDARPADA